MIDQTKGVKGEEWRPVLNWPYLVSNLGRLACIGNRQLKKVRDQAYDQHGRARMRYVYLKNNGRIRSVMLGTLVAEAFHGSPPKGHMVKYLDRNFNNNRADNLVWAPEPEAKAWNMGAPDEHSDVRQPPAAS